jgi:DNA-binding XRE family transcriptional regulator
MSAEALAREIGRASITVYRWEWGHAKPRVADVASIAAALRCRIAELTGGAS